jgi:cytochrome c biogenesis protein CcmG/thiol:disulfide interchange protein DsbE
MRRKHLLTGAGVVVLAAVLAIGVSQATDHGTSGLGPLPSPAQIRADLGGSPPALAALHASANQFLEGGSSALQARLKSLHGHPVVVNKWASWCMPCRQEFPVFQRVSAKLGRTVAFIGIDSSDKPSAGAAFLRRFPVSYPSYSDPGGSLGTATTLSTNFPVTVFYDRDGRQSFIHQGGFTSVAQLDVDIRRYALQG